MIFGFNTDIAVAGTVYHVQTRCASSSRARIADIRPWTLHRKRAAVLPSDATEEGIQELARAQHRWVVEAVREVLWTTCSTKPCSTQRA